MRSIQSQLREKGLAQVDKKVEKKEVRPKETLSKRDLKELMGINTPTYRRSKGGAIRQK